MLNPSRIRINALLIFFSSLILFNLGLSQQEITAFDSRFYLFAQEMLYNGFSWFPTTYNEWYPDYPGAWAWLVVCLAKLFGLSKLTVTFPTIFFASLTLSFTYLTGCLESERVGWAGVLFLLLTLFFMRTVRTISLDMIITAITTIVFYVVHPNERKSGSRNILWVYPLLFLGFMIRGPIGLVMPVGVMCAYYTVNKQYKIMFKRGLIAFALLMVSIFLLTIISYHVGGSKFVMEVLRMQIFGRLESASLPRYFYLTDSIGSYALAYPIMLLALIAAARQRWIKKITTSDLKFIGLLASWVFIILLGMSVPADKKVRYILPMLPACALIAGAFYCSQKITFCWIKKFLTMLFLVLPSVCFAMVYWIQLKHNYFPIHFQLCLTGFALLQGLTIILYWKLHDYINSDLYILSIAAFYIQLFLFNSHGATTNLY